MRLQMPLTCATLDLALIKTTESDMNDFFGDVMARLAELDKRCQK